MSYTILPNKKLKEPFFTNVNSESMIGSISRTIGAVHHFEGGAYPLTKMAYTMTKKESLDTIAKLTEFIENKEMITVYFSKEGRLYFQKGANVNNLIHFIKLFIAFLKDSEGYKTDW